MPDDTRGDDALRASLRAVGRADGLSAVRRLSGGVIADTWLISWADGTSAVGKIVNGAAPDLFRTEADGLAALRGTGRLLHLGRGRPVHAVGQRTPARF